MDKLLTVFLALTFTQPIFAQREATPVTIPGYTPPNITAEEINNHTNGNSTVTTTATPSSAPMPIPEAPTTIPKPGPSAVPSPMPTEIPLPNSPTPGQAAVPAPTEPAPHFTPELPPANEIPKRAPPGVYTPMPEVPTNPVLTPPPSQVSTPTQTPVPVVPPTSVPTPVPQQVNPPIINPLPSPTSLLSPKLTTSLAKLMTCKRTTITKEDFPARMSNSYENVSGKILGWENNRCHLIMNISFKTTSQLAENENSITSECFLTRTTLQNFYSAVLNYTSLENLETKTALLDAFKQYMQECTTTIKGKKIRFP